MGCWAQGEKGRDRARLAGRAAEACSSLRLTQPHATALITVQYVMLF